MVLLVPPAVAKIAQKLSYDVFFSFVFFFFFFTFCLFIYFTPTLASRNTVEGIWVGV